MKSPFYSRGLSTGGWIFMVMLIGGVITVGTKLAPLYMDHNTMSKVLDGMAAERGLVEQRTSAIEAMVRKRFKLNNIRDFDFDNMTISRPEDRIIIDIAYEVRIPLVHNVDLVASFAKHTELRD